MNNALAKKFNFKSLIIFTLPTIAMMIFMSAYTMVDGIFVSNLIGSDALSAINIIFPVQAFILAIGIMLASGGSAVIAAKMGAGKSREANENFTLIMITGVVISAVIMIFGLIFIEPLVHFLGATEKLAQYCIDYLKVILFFVPFGIMQMLFQSFFVAAGKPMLGLICTVTAGLVNVALDYVFIAIAKMGIAGAALATGIGYCIPAITGIVFFSLNRKGSLYFTKPKPNFKVLGYACFNGMSEMVTNLANAVTTFMYNYIMLKYLGENGVAAITIILYSQFLLSSVYLGFSTGVAPIFSYNYGENNGPQTRRVFKISLLFILISSLFFAVIAQIFAPLIVMIFAKNNPEVQQIAIQGFRIFSICFLFSGINIFASALFTAFSNGVVSALISLLRTFVFILVLLLTLPLVFGATGVFIAVPLAEFLTLGISVGCMAKYRKRYRYARLETDMDVSLSKTAE